MALILAFPHDPVMVFPQVLLRPAPSRRKTAPPAVATGARDAETIQMNRLFHHLLNLFECILKFAADVVKIDSAARSITQPISLLCQRIIYPIALSATVWLP